MALNKAEKNGLKILTTNYKTKIADLQKQLKEVSVFLQERIKRDDERQSQLRAQSDLMESIKPRPIDIKSEWKHNAKTLEEIVTYMNNESFIEDELEMMEYVDLMLCWIDSKLTKTDKGE